jgi:hypothetical protein
MFHNQPEDHYPKMLKMVFSQQMKKEIQLNLINTKTINKPVLKICTFATGASPTVE